MDTIPYRNTKLHIKTIPKGTLLFRLVKDPINDVRGVPLEDGTRCITPNQNVFFHPNPFMGKLSLAVESKSYSKIRVYLTTKDLKVIALLVPSKYSRRDKSRKRTFIKSCADVKQGCLPKPRVWFDPCLSDTIIKKYPDVVGIMAIAITDVQRLQKALDKRKTLRKVKKYIHDAEDVRGVKGPPELILHPLTKRPSKDVIVKSEDKLENNYKLLRSIDIENIGSIYSFMNQHAVYDPNTYYFTYKA